MDTSTPKYFEVKKYFMVAICFIDILILITYAALAGVMADSLLEHIMDTIQVDDKSSGRVSFLSISLTIVPCKCGAFLFCLL